MTGLVQGPHVLCLSQMQVVANPAEPYELPIWYSEMALHNSLKLNLFLIYYRTDTLKIPDGQLECKYAGNRLNAVCLLALYQQQGETPMPCFRVYMAS